jgi:hypothetical protein
MTSRYRIAAGKSKTTFGDFCFMGAGGGVAFGDT